MEFVKNITKYVDNNVNKRPIRLNISFLFLLYAKKRTGYSFYYSWDIDFSSCYWWSNPKVINFKEIHWKSARTDT